MPRITLYSRPDCHLCEDARRVLIMVGEPFLEIDIDRDDELFKRYLERIPVVAIDGEDVFELFLDEGELRSRLQ